MQPRIVIVIHVLFAVSIANAFYTTQKQTAIAATQKPLLSSNPVVPVADNQALDAAALAARNAETRSQTLLSQSQNRTTSTTPVPIAMPQKINLSPNAVVHTIGVYEVNDDPDNTRPAWWAECGETSTDECFEKMKNEKNTPKPVQVHVETSTNPVVLVLTAYESVIWNLKLNGQKIDAIIISGYKKQQYLGIPSGIPIYMYTHEYSSCNACTVNENGRYFYAYEFSNISDINKNLMEIFGRPADTFQGDYKGYQFSINNQTPKINYKYSQP